MGWSPTQTLSKLVFYLEWSFPFPWPHFFHYNIGGQDISLPQGLGSELLVTELRSVGHKERMEQESHVA